MLILTKSYLYSKLLKKQFLIRIDDQVSKAAILKITAIILSL